MFPPIFLRPLSNISRVGQRTESILKKLGLVTQANLLMYFPLRFEDLRKMPKLNSIPLNTPVTVRGTIEIIGNKYSPRKGVAVTEALVRNDQETLRVVWYRQPFLVKNLKVGDQVSLSGKVIQNKFGVFMQSPQYEKVDIRQSLTHTGRIVPFYSLAEGLTQKQIRTLVRQILPLVRFLPEWLPQHIRVRNKLLPLQQALTWIHFPPTFSKLSQARQRLQFDEIFSIQLGVLQYQQFLAHNPARALPFHETAIREFVERLPFRLTTDQKKAAWQILQDLEKTTPMNRLLQGDVGVGKTVVAAIAAYNCILSDLRVAVMSPTEVLARQTFATFRKLLPEKVRVALVTGSEKHDTAAVDIIIGTHALIQEQAALGELGLVIIDEQHRFGVGQRRMLRYKTQSRNGAAFLPHLLSMTATPIPRSLMLTLYGDLAVSQIRMKPQGRAKVACEIIGPTKRKTMYEKIHTELESGRQALVICPIIEESDVLGVAAATTEYERLQRQVFPTYRLGLLHGRLKPKEKDKVMEQFRRNEVQMLVATSVVEVGIDVPNATVIVIEGAERFGLAQLHQLRGRVGRGTADSYCFLITEAGRVPARLEMLARTHDGFALAEADLKFRGPGTFYGTTQSGFVPNLKIASLSDLPLIEAARAAAQEILEEDPALTRYPLLAQKLSTWQKNFHLE